MAGTTPVVFTTINGEAAVAYGSEWLSKSRGRTYGQRNGEEFSLENAICLKASDKYVDVHMTDGGALIMSMSLSAMEKVLDPDEWVRISHSCIIKRDKLESIEVTYTPHMTKCFQVKLHGTLNRMGITRRYVPQARLQFPEAFSEMESEIFERRQVARRKFERSNDGKTLGPLI